MTKSKVSSHKRSKLRVSSSREKRILDVINMAIWDSEGSVSIRWKDHDCDITKALDLVSKMILRRLKKHRLIVVSPRK